MKKKILTATITGATMGFAASDGKWTFVLTLSSDNTEYSFGFYDFNRHGCGMELIAEVLKTVGVDIWESLKGKECRFIDNGTKSTDTIGHITDDKWLNVYDFFNKYLDKAVTK